MIREEVLNYFKGDELATDVFLSKYSLNKEETPDQMHHRLAKEFSRVDSKYNNSDNITWNKLSYYGRHRDNLTEESIYNLFKDFKYIIPGGSVMQSCGTKRVSSLSNCFFNGELEDDINDIYDKAKSMAQIGKMRGGTSTDLSKLRPRGAKVNNSSNESSGPIPFLDLLDTTGKLIGQNGRKMAMMVTMDINHPDIKEFAIIKNDLTKVTNANLSIKVNSEFIQAVKDNKDYILRWPCNQKAATLSGKLEYNILTYDSFANQYCKKIKAKELWDTIINSAWKYAEPGLLMWDTVINNDPTSVYPELKPRGTNPCSELPLGELDSCRLICVNLYSLVDKPFTKEAAFNKDLAYKIFYECQVLADDLVDLELEAIDRILTKINPEYVSMNINFDSTVNYIKTQWITTQSEEFKLWWKIREIGAKGRRTGTGITGYADMLAALGIDYGNEAITNEVFKLKLEAELDATIDMAIIRGTFPLWDVKKEFPTKDGILSNGNNWYKFITDNYLYQSERMILHGRRNSGISTVAPTGTVSLLTQTTSGIEPLFQPYYTRRKKCNPGEKPDFTDNNKVGFKEFTVLHPKFKDWFIIASEAEHYPKGAIDRLRNASSEALSKVFKESPWYNQTAGDINWEKRINTQSIIQKYISSSISSTVNLPKDTPKEVVEKLYLTAFDKGLKGLTVYVDGSRSGILVNSSNTKEQEFKDHSAPKRPKELKANIHIIKSKGKRYAVVIGLLENKPYEVFVFNTLNSNIKDCSGKIIKVERGHYRFTSESLTIENLDESGNTELERACAVYTSMLLRHGANIHYVNNTARKIDDSITSFVSAMSRVLAKYDTIIEEEKCPECGGRLVKEAGCCKCLDCGYSKCN